MTKAKIAKLRQISSEYLIDLVEIEYEQNWMNLIYEYIHRKLDNEIWKVSDMELNKIKDQMIELGYLLSREGVRH